MPIAQRDVVLNLLASFAPVRDPLRRLYLRPPSDDAVVSSAFDRLRVRRQFIGDDRIRGSSLLEIGSGRNMCLAVLLLGLGARRVVNAEIDRYRFRLDQRLYRRLVERANAEGIAIDWPPPGLVLAPDGRTLRPDGARLALHLGRTAASIPEPEEAFDTTFSVAVLEHVRREAMQDVAHELYRLTRPGGIGYHRIDLVDHFHRHDDPFRFLRFNARDYDRMFSNRASASNRFRMDDFERIFTQARFQQVEFEDILPHPDVAEFRRWMPGFHEDFRDRDPEMMRALECMLVVHRQ